MIKQNAYNLASKAAKDLKSGDRFLHIDYEFELVVNSLTPCGNGRFNLVFTILGFPWPEDTSESEITISGDDEIAVFLN